MIDQLPALSSRVIARESIADWLEDHADLDVRLIVAPPGFGKTTALVAYAHRVSQRRRMYLLVDGHTTSEAFAEALVRAFAPATPIEILLDDMHLASDGLRTTINALIADLPPGVVIVIASQRRDNLDVGTLFARGLVALCDQSQLGLNVAEVCALFAAQDIEVSAAAIDALVTRADGWPPAITGTLRELARERQSVDAAYARWRDAWAVPARDLIGVLLERVPFLERAATWRHFSHGAALDQATLSVLHRCGFFVRFTNGTFALMDWIDELFGSTRSMRERPALRLGLFGRFTANVADVAIVWARRRDQHIIKYLALQPDGSATRARLADVFWPGVARPLAMQNLRTACSTIRRAIGNAIGIENVDLYFIAGERLVLNRATVVSDVELFRRHVTLADADDAAGAVGDAIVQLRAAESLYGNGLFAGDVSQPAFLDDARELGEIYARVLARLSDALIERGSPELARAYAAKALRLGLFHRHGDARTHVDLRFAAS